MNVSPEGQPGAEGSGSVAVRRAGRLPAARRIHATGEFKRVYDARCAVHTALVVAFVLPNGRAQARLGVSVSRQHGGAVQRNRIKRVLRAAFRQFQARCPAGIDMVLVPRKGVPLERFTAANVLAALEQNLKALRAKAQLAARAASPKEPDAAPAGPVATDTQA